MPSKSFSTYHSCSRGEVCSKKLFQIHVRLLYTLKYARTRTRAQVRITWTN